MSATPNRIQEYFIGHHLRSTDDVFEHARTVLVLRFSIVFFFLFFLPVIADIVEGYDKLLVFHLFDLVSIATFPFVVKYTRRIDIPINIFFILTIFSSVVVFLMVSPMKLEMVGMSWIFFFAALNALLQRGRTRIVFAILIWVPVIYVIVNIGMNGALTIESLVQRNAENPPAFLVFVPAAMLVYAMWTHTSTIDKARGLITLQKNEIENRNKDITDSITYARHLQEALLPPVTEMREVFPASEVYYRPKAIVAGDFYWMEKNGDRVYIAAADCTGHGVPGAMVSVVCSGALTRSVREFNLSGTGPILDKTRELIIETFGKSSSSVNDGMDISLLCVDRSSGKVTWSGANNSLWMISGEELQVVKADKQPVGRNEHHRAFATHEVNVQPGSTVYLFTDGLADQFGGPDGKKFKYKRISDFLIEHRNLPVHQRMEKLEGAFLAWKGNLEQVDDICIIALPF